MRIFGFGPDMGRHVGHHGSDFVMSRIAHPDSIHVGCIYLEPGGRVGHHPAGTCQLFIVVHGSGWVEGEDRTQVPITAGEAAFWEPGERHGAGTEIGMTAIVVEGDILGGAPHAVGPVA